MRRRSRFGLIVLLIVAPLVVVSGWLVLGRRGGDPGVARRVILVTIDSLRAAALPFHGNARVQTPTLTRLRDRGVWFERATAPSPWTLPTLASIQSGLPPGVHGLLTTDWAVSDAFPKGVQTLAERLRDAGYRTAAFGCNPFLELNKSVQRGFQDATFVSGFDAEKNRPRFPEGTTEYLTNKALEWLAAHGREDYFLWIHYYDPHRPYSPPQKWYRDPPSARPMQRAQHLPPKVYEKWVRDMNDRLTRTLNLQRDEHLANKVEELAECERYMRDVNALTRSLYEGEVRHVDNALGRLLAALEETGTDEDTLIVVTSDHGEEFYEHDGLEHGHAMYEELLHVPLLVKPPRCNQPLAIKQRVSVLSVFPTILEQCGLPHDDEQSCAPSLVGAWSGKEVAYPPMFVAESTLYGASMTAVILGQKKYIRNDKTGGEELYDLDEDPGERTSVLDTDTAAATEARQRLADYRRWAGKLRRHLQISPDRRVELDERQRRTLRSHGYLK